MKFITITELNHKTTAIIKEIENTKEDIIITKKGKPIAKLQFITQDVFTIKEVSK